ncbi:unnamed protein product [Cuscuta epithymum]|uniref:Uncharacterized protein n=1 Tax=Cuscuta epithymum TaxID=186058 RepID=A0AAV0E8X4_9ASTE|nr:unnamed protein product [Cuscuta epithymum]
MKRVQCPEVKWTKEKQEQLFRLVDAHGGDWKTIGATLGTSPSLCRSLHSLLLADKQAKRNESLDPQCYSAWKRQAYFKKKLHLTPKKSCTALPAIASSVRSRLKQFAGMNRFKKMALRVIGEHLSAEREELIRIMFTLLDTDHDGKITCTEFSAGLRKVKDSLLDKPEVFMLMEVADIDRKGYVDYGDFVAVAIHLQKMEIDEHFQIAFSYFDKNGSGYIELDDLRERLAAKSGEPDAGILNLILSEVDTDKDGRINYEEFVAMMKKY